MKMFRPCSVILSPGTPAKRLKKLALEVVGDLAALKAEHDQIATSDRNLLLDVDERGREGSASS